MEDIQIIETGKIELHTIRKKRKAGLCQLCAPFACQHVIQSFLQLVQIQHVAGGIFSLCLGQGFAAPVRTAAP